MFRREARIARQQRLLGTITIHNPVSWQIIVYSLALALGALTIYLFVGSYARVETVQGRLRPDSGVALITPTRAGRLENVRVKDGMLVSVGAPLATVRVEEIGLDGVAPLDNVLRNLEEQTERLTIQERSILSLGEHTRTRLTARTAGLREEIREIDQQIEMQNRLVEGAEADVERATEIAAQGYLSKRDLQSRQDALFTRRQQLAVLKASRADRLASLIDTEQSIRESADSTRSGAARISNERSDVVQRRMELVAARGYTISSPVNGTVTGVTARVGQQVQVGSSLMLVVPAQATLQAELAVPSSAIGFLKIGQETRLQIAAYPYERFGTVRASIQSVSSAASIDPAGGTGPHYLVVARIDEPRIRAFGQVYNLQPDMLVTANIVTERRSLIEWIFEPLFAVRKR